MHKDEDIQRDLMEELNTDPSIRNDDIAVAVKNGIVTLAGYTDSYLDKYTAERLAGRIKGVKGVVNNIEVKLPSASTRADPDIARAAINALEWNISVPSDRIKVKVEKGWVTLEGDVDWFYQKEAAERSVRYLTGIKGVTNLITVRPRATPSDVKQRIKQALERAAEFDADHITIDVQGSTVTLRGTVRSWAERRDAERAARNVPGVTEVENKLTVDPNILAPV
ncbi:MAG TPA: BON domain-containing protein [Gemmatimonadales bacterium]|nr:BON domain-containing protein [Gemmatimonadales bacterium]